jgi:uncharacterized lipoprotein YmbA
MVAACAANPDQSVYVMPAPASLTAAPGSLALKLRPVILPDYLDTTDLVTRTGQFGMQASRTGRWGERLSEGVTRTLAADLGHRLHATIVGDGAAGAPYVQIMVTISAFDVTASTSVLAASWTAVWLGTAGRAPVSGHGTFSTSVAAAGGDVAVVAAMAATVADLSDAMTETFKDQPRERSNPDTE